jgi:MFS family permease
MLGLGIGCVISSPTALIFGKRPVYLAGVVLFLASSIWAAASKSYPSLVVARIVMGIGVAVSRLHASSCVPAWF